MWGHYTYHIQLSPRDANHMNVITLPNLSVRVAPPISHKPFKLIPLVTWVLEMPPNTLHPWVNSELGQQHTKLTWPQSKFYSIQAQLGLSQFTKYHAILFVDTTGCAANSEQDHWCKPQSGTCTWAYITDVHCIHCQILTTYYMHFALCSRSQEHTVKYRRIWFATHCYIWHGGC